MTYPIPGEAFDDRLAFVGTSGSGKTYAALGALARLLKMSGSRMIAVDALGAMWGLRLMADGKTPSGHDIVIFGGPHGDLPINEHAGKLIGETVATMRESVILDLCELGTDAAERRFMLAFLTVLYRNVRKELTHLIFDEADMWAPQLILDKEGESMKLLGMMKTIVRRGRLRGFIPWLITQRPAELSKSVLSMMDGIVAMGMTGSQDRDAVGAWIKGQADKKAGQAILDSLPGKQIGEGVVWVPRRKILLPDARFPENKTFDSSRAPKRGEKRQKVELPPLDLTALRARMATVVDEAKANDPVELRRHLAATQLLLKQALATPKAAASVPVAKINVADQKAQAKALEAAGADGFRQGVDVTLKAAREAMDGLVFEIGTVLAAAGQRTAVDVEKAIKRAVDDLRKAGAAKAPKAMPAVLVLSDKSVGELQATLKASGPVRDLMPARSAGEPVDGLTNPQKALLKSLAWWRAMGHGTVTRAQAAAIAKWAPHGSNVKDRTTELKRMGLVEQPEPGTIAMTDAGVAAAPEPDTNQTLVDSVHAILTGPQDRVFTELLKMRDPPGGVPRADLAAALGWEPSGSNIKDRMTELVRLEIAEYPRPGFCRLQDWVQ